MDPASADPRISSTDPFARVLSSVIPHLFPLILLGLLPTSLAFFNEYWAFTSSQASFIDPWLYPSYFLHLRAQLVAFPAGYYGDRLSDTIPGWVIYHVFGPWVGNYVFKLIVIWTALFSTYFTVSRLFNRRVAVISGLLICAQPYFLMAFGWDYVDGIGIAYCSLAILFVFRAAQSKSDKLSLFLAGIFCACLITSQFLWLNLAWIIPLGYLLANRIGHGHNAWKGLAILALGGVAAFAVFCGIYYGLTGQWFYLANSLDHTLLQGLGAAQKVNSPLSAWLNTALWLVQYNGIIFIAVWLIFRHNTEPREWLCLVLFTTAYATIWAWQAVQFPFAMLSFYTSFLYPFYAIGLAAILNRPLNKLNERASWFVVGTCLLGSLIVYSLVGIWDQLPAAMLRHPLGRWLWAHGMVSLSVALFSVTILVWMSRMKQSWPVVVFLIGIFSVYAAQLGLQQKQGWFSGNGEFTNKQGFRLVLDADAWVNQRQPDRKLLWWSDQQEPRQGVIYGVTSLYLWGWSLLNLNLPQLPLQDAERLETQPTVLVLSWNPDALNKAREAFAVRGFSVVKEEATTITNGALALNLGLFRVRKAGSLAADFVAKEGLREVPDVFHVNQILAAGPNISIERGTFVQLGAIAPQWAYLGYLPLQLPDKADEFWIRLTVKVVKGQIGFGILNDTETDFYERKFLNADDEVREVLLNVAHPAESKKLIIENGEQGGQESEVIVQKISVFARPDSPLWKATQKGAAHAQSR